MQQPNRRGPWSTHEDDTLIRLVHHYGAHNWVRISQHMRNRSPKQCRERYHQNLKPSLNHDPITPEEGAQIHQLVGEMGKRWAEIARRLHGRSDNAVKNWWNGGQNRRKRQSQRQRCKSNSYDHSSNAPSSPSQGSRSPLFESLPPIHRLTVDVNGRPEDQALVSPSFSEISRGQTPSLVSDYTSNCSTSPRAPASPATPENTLPPMLGLYEHGRQCVPTSEPQLGCDYTFYQYARQHSLETAKLPPPALDFARPRYVRCEIVSDVDENQHDRDNHYLRHRLPQHLNGDVAKEDVQNRMKLSNLLC